MKKFLSGRKLAAMITVLLSVCLAVSPVGAAETLKNSDVFLTYAFYLDTADPELSAGWNIANDVVNNVTSDDITLTGFVDTLKKAEGVFTGTIGSFFGLDTDTETKCNIAAARLLLEEMANQPEGAVDDLANQLETGKKVFDDYIKAGTNHIEDFFKILDAGLTNEEKEKMLKPLNDMLKGLDFSLDLGMAIEDAAMAIYFYDSVKISALYNMISMVESEDLKKGLQKHLDYIVTDYEQYVMETYLTEEVLSKTVGTIKDCIMEAYSDSMKMSGMYGICRSALKYMGTGIGLVTNYIESEDYVIAVSLQRYCTEMRGALQEERDYIRGHVPEYDRICGFQEKYNIYVAAVRAYIKAAEKLARNESTLNEMNDCLKKIEENVSFKKHMENCKKKILSIASDDRVRNNIEENDYVKVEGDTELLPPTDEMEEGKIYLSEGKLNYDLRVQPGAVLTINRDAELPCIELAPTYNNESAKLIVGEDAFLHLTDYYRYEKGATLVIRGKMKVDTNFFEYGEENYYKTSMELEGEKARLEVLGELEAVSVNMTGGEIVAHGETLMGIGEWSGTIRLDTPANMEASVGRFSLNRLGEEEDIVADTEEGAAADITLTHEEGQPYVFSGTAPSHELEVSDFTQVGEIELGGLCVQTGEVKLSGAVKVKKDMREEAGASLIVEEGASLDVLGNVRPGSAAMRTTVRGEMNLAGKFETLTYNNTPTYYVKVEGEAAKLNVVGGGYIHELDLEGGEVHLGADMTCGRFGNTWKGSIWLEQQAGQTFLVDPRTPGKPQYFLQAIEGKSGENAKILLTGDGNGGISVSGSAPCHRLRVTGNAALTGETHLGELEAAYYNMKSAHVDITGTVTVDGDLTMYKGAGIIVESTAKLDVARDVKYADSPAHDTEVMVRGKMNVGGCYQKSAESDEILKLDIYTTVEGENAQLEVVTGNLEPLYLEGGEVVVHGGVESFGLGRMLYWSWNGTLRIKLAPGVSLVTDELELTAIEGKEAGASDLAFTRDVNVNYVLSGIAPSHKLLAKSSFLMEGSMELGGFGVTGSECVILSGALAVSGDITTASGALGMEEDAVLNLNGDAEQNVSFSSPESSPISHLEITNPSGKVVFATPIICKGLFNHNGNAFTLFEDGQGSEFIDYDGDGIPDHQDPHPTKPDQKKGNFTVSLVGEPPYVYTDGSRMPAVEVRDEDGKLLTEVVDYNVSYTYEAQPGELAVTVTVTGTGLYDGVQELTFEMVCGHVWNTEPTVDREPTCAEEGQQSIHCGICGAVQEGSETPVPLTDVHDVQEWTQTKAASCIEEGEQTGTCVVCGKEITETVPKTDHVWNAAPTVEKEPGCEEEGLQSIHCSVCDIVQEGSETVVPATGHQVESWTQEKAATCTEEGIETGSCTVCMKDVTRAIPKTDHVWNETVLEQAACEKEGAKAVICGVCGAVQEGSGTAIPATGHQVESWTITKAATCAEEGVESGFCAVCNSDVTRAIPKTEHTPEWIQTKQATIFEDGLREYKCTVCQQTIASEVVARLAASVRLNATAVPMKKKASSNALKIVECAEGDRVVEWTSSDSRVLKVNQRTGKMTALKTGKAIVTVLMQSGAQASCKITVQNNKVVTKKLTVDQKKVTLKKGEKFTINVTRTPITAVEKIKFTSSNKKVATVDGKGKVTARKAGSAVIMAKSANGKKVKVKIVVK